MKVPVSTPDITKADIKNVTACMKAGWVSGISRWVEDFESNFAKFIGTEYAVATGSGTTALHLACATLDIRPGDEVIMPTFTMIASANAVRYLGAKPVFVDSDPQTWCMDVNQIQDKITKKTVAIMPVHIYGHPCDMKPLIEMSEDASLWVIEDAAESHGADIEGMGRTGSIGDIGAFSLYANKIITTGEGGILTMHHKKDYERAKWLRAHAFGRHGRHYWHEEVGYGYRMSGLQAALGLGQLERIDYYIEKRRLAANVYMMELLDLMKKNLISFPAELEGFKNVYWMFSILIKDNIHIDRDDVMDHLKKKGIETRTFFYPLHIMLPYKTSEEFPVAEDIANRGMNLPSGNQLTIPQIKYVCKCIKELF